MRLRAGLMLALRALRQSPGRSLSSLFGIALGVASLTLFLGLGLGMRDLVLEQLFPSDARLIEVRSPAIALGGLTGARLDEPAVERLTALEDVAKVHRHLAVQAPATAHLSGDLFGERLSLRFELMVEGVDPSLFSLDLPEERFVDPGPAHPIPAVAARRLLGLWNLSFAPSRGLPTLSEELVTGLELPVRFGRGFFGAGAADGGRGAAESRLVARGLSDRVAVGIAAIPLEAAARLNRELGVEQELYSAFTVEARSLTAAARLRPRLERLGYRVGDGGGALRERVSFAATLVSAAFAFLGLLICLLAGLSIAQGFSASVRARLVELGLYRAVGASRGELARLLLIEALLVGAIGGLVGLGACVALGFTLEATVGAQLADLLDVDAVRLVRLPLPLLVATPTLGLVVALLGGLPAARQATRAEPTALLSG